MTAWNALECALIWLVAALAVGMLIGGVIEYRDRQPARRGRGGGPMTHGFWRQLRTALAGRAAESPRCNHMHVRPGQSLDVVIADRDGRVRERVSGTVDSVTGSASSSLAEHIVLNEPTPRFPTEPATTKKEPT